MMRLVPVAGNSCLTIRSLIVLNLVCGAGDRCPAHRRCRQEQRLCWLTCSNCWETKVTGNSLRCWSAKQVWSKQRMRKWWTECCEACTSMTWKSSGKHMSWKAGKLETRITSSQPLQIGMVYQLANLRMLEFYYDFLDRYFDCCIFELIHMDTDSNYISADQLEDIVRPELHTEF